MVPSPKFTVTVRSAGVTVVSLSVIVPTWIEGSFNPSVSLIGGTVAVTTDGTQLASPDPLFEVGNDSFHSVAAGRVGTDGLPVVAVLGSEAS